MEEKGHPDLQLVIRCGWVTSPSESTAYIIENLDFFVPSTLREKRPSAIAVGNPLSRLWEAALGWPGLADATDQGRCYPLSQVPLFNMFGCCWLKHFPAHFCLLVWLGSHRLAVCVQRFLRPSAWAVSMHSTDVTRLDFLEASSISRWSGCISSPLLRTNKDWLVFRSR